jgi:hypothetical protein
MRCSATSFVFLCAFLYCISFSSTDVTIRGTIKDNANNSLSGATAVLLKAGLTATSNSSGEFTITGTIPTIGTKFNGKLQDPSVQKPVYNGSKLLFTIPAQPKRVRIDIFDIKGKLLGTVLNERLMGGSYSVSPLGTLKGTASSMLYLVRIRIDTDVATFVIPQVTSTRRAYAVFSRTFETTDLSKFSAGAVDTLEVTLCGYLLSRRPIESYSQTAVAVTMAEGSLNASTEQRIDSLFDRLRDRIGSLDSIDSADQFKSKDFASLRDGFNDILTSKDSYHMKASIGYIVSSVLALNTNASFWRLVDSLDAYLSAIDSSSNTTLSRAIARPKGLMKKSLASGGVAGFGKTLAAVSWSSLALSSADPSFPKFITLSYIQSIAENDVVPIITSVIAACSRMESCGDRSLFLEIEGDTFEIDKGEIHLLDAQMRLLRAGLNGFCMYDMNIYSVGSDDYSWIDSLRHLESSSRYVYSLSGDTLQTLWMNDNVVPASFVARLIRHNMQRAGFMTQRRAVGQMVKNDLLAVPSAIKTGIAYIRAETDDQANDIIKISDLMNADRDLVDVPQQMIDDGVSAALANKFRTPESIADFVTELLSGPYTFNEMTQDSIRIDITVDITAMLDTAVYDLRTLFPKYTWLPENEWVIRTQDNSSMWPANSNIVYVNPEDSLAIPAPAIESIDSSDGFYSVVYLKSDYAYKASIDSSITILPLCLLDDSGNKIDFEDIPDMVDAKTFFPYFNDYTVGGVFPGMTRQKWIDLIYQE